MQNLEQFRDSDKLFLKGGKYFVCALWHVKGYALPAL